MVSNMLGYKSVVPTYIPQLVAVAVVPLENILAVGIMPSTGTDFFDAS